MSEPTIPQAMRAMSDALERFATMTAPSVFQDGVTSKAIAHHVMIGIVVALHSAANELESPKP